jgi:hypothetical protein
MIIEVEAIRMADAELDMAAIMREYLANEERVNQATREALERRGYDFSKFNQVKREMADVRGFKLGDDGVEFLINQMLEFLLDLAERRGGLFRRHCRCAPSFLQIMKKHLDIDEDIEREARGATEAPAGGHQRLRDRVPEGAGADSPRSRPDLS